MDLRIAAFAAIVALLDVAQTVQLLIGGVVLATALAVGRAKRKDATISDLEKALDARDERLTESQAQLAGATDRANREREKREECQQRAAKLEGQLEELRPYGEAFSELSRRIERTESVLGTAMEQHGALVMESTAVASQSVKALERITVDLGKLGEDFAAVAVALGATGERPPGAV